MKTITILLLFCSFSFAQDVWVNTSSGGYWRTAPNYTNRDNYSTLGNINPHTGKEGTILPDNNVQYFNSAEASLNNLLSQRSYNLPNETTSYSYLYPSINVNRIVNDSYPITTSTEKSASVFKGGRYFNIKNGKRNYVKQTISN
jgi:hypothetical protein